MGSLVQAVGLAAALLSVGGLPFSTLGGTALWVGDPALEAFVSTAAKCLPVPALVAVALAGLALRGRKEPRGLAAALGAAASAGVACLQLSGSAVVGRAGCAVAVVAASGLVALWGARLVADEWRRRAAVYMGALCLSAAAYSALLAAPPLVFAACYAAVPLLGGALLSLSPGRGPDGGSREARPEAGGKACLLFMLAAVACASLARLFASFMTAIEPPLSQAVPGWVLTAALAAALLAALALARRGGFPTSGAWMLLAGAAPLLVGMLCYLSLSGPSGTGALLGYMGASSSARLLEVVGLLYASEAVALYVFPALPAYALSFLFVKMLTPFFTIMSSWLLAGYSEAVVSVLASAIVVALVAVLVVAAWKAGGLRARPAAEGPGGGEGFAAPGADPVASFALACGLTGREEEVLRAVATGGTVKSAASRLGLSQNTVQTHLKTIYRKAGVHSRAELVSRVWQSAEEEGAAGAAGR